MPPTFRPLIDKSIEEFDEDGFQTVFAISPFGNSETRDERIARWVRDGFLDLDCDGCQETLNDPRLDAFVPSHKPSSGCRSGGRHHCTCPTCWG